EQIRHLDGCHSGIKTLVTGLAAGSIRGLFFCVGRQHSERHGYACLGGSRGDPTRSLSGNIIEMRRVAANHSAQAYYGVRLLMGDKCPGSQRNFPGTRNVHDIDSPEIGAMLLERIHRTFEEFIRNEVVEAAHYDGESE